MTMRLAIVDDGPIPFRYPLYRHLAGIVPELTVFFCAPHMGRFQWRLPRDPGFPCRILPGATIRLAKPPFGEPRTILINPGLFSNLRRFRPDAVVAYAFSVPTWMAFLYTRVFRKAFISWYEDTPHTEAHLSPRQRWIRRRIIPRADACITPTREARDTFLSYGADARRIWVAPHCADESLERQVESFRRQGRTYSNRNSIPGPLILYVGALSELKGVHHLLEAFGQTLARIPNATLCLAGDGPMRGTLRAAADRLDINGRVRFTGFVEPDTLADLYAGADLFVFPTLGDTYGAVIGEAASAGLPIIASPFAGAAAELVVEGMNGRLVDPTRPGILADAIVGLLSEETRRKEMSRASLTIARDLTPEKAAGRFAEAASAALHHRASRG
jgi:glycosyltransferase involved in cell wall biosynthesis